MKVVILMGRSGSGKSTVASVLAERLGFMHISTGELAREHIVGSWQEMGFPAPERQIRELVADMVNKHKGNDGEGIIIDGMPRKPAQVAFLLNLLRGDTLHFIDLNIDRTLSEQRLIVRSRKDDTPESIKNRLDTYDNTQNKIHQEIIKRRLKVSVIDANKSINDVVENINLEVL